MPLELLGNIIDRMMPHIANGTYPEFIQGETMADLFDSVDPAPTLAEIQRRMVPTPHARNEHPDTSHIAAAQVEVDGTLTRMAKLCLEMIIKHPDSTGREIESFAGDASGQLHKRCDDLRRAGLIFIAGKRKCEITGKMAQTWRKL